MAAGVTLGFDQAPPTAQLGFAVVQANALFLSATGGTALPQAATPTFSPVAGSYSGTQTVTISDTTTGSSIYLTTDGTTPTYPITGSTRLYASPITVSVSDTVKAIAVATGYLNSSVSSASYTISAGSTNYVGVNLNGLSYYNPEQPWLNLFNGAGSNGTGGNGIWFTSSSSALDTNEEPWLAVDANGCVTSLTATNGGVGNGNGTGGNQQFNFVQTFINVSLNNQDGTGYANGVPPGASSLYPTGSYTFQFQGAFTGTLTGDVSGLAVASGAVTVSGSTITSTLAPGAVGTVTFNITAATTAGIVFALTALPSNTNYLQSPAIVQTSLLASYNAGARFHPNFLSALSNIGYSRIRYMDWLQTNSQTINIGFATTLIAGATTAVLGRSDNEQGFSFASALTSGTTNAPLATAWQWATGSVAFVTSANQIITMGVTKGQTTTSGWSAAIGTAASAVCNTYLWGYPTGNYTFVIGNNASEAADTVQLISCAMTYQSGSVTFNTPLTQNVSQTFAYGVVYYSAFAPRYAGWSARPGKSLMSYNVGGGVPYEVCLDLAKTLGVDAWLTIPAWANQYQGYSGFWTSLATLIQTYISNGFTNKIYIEFSNEVWNTTFEPGIMLGVIGYTQFGAHQNFTYSTQEYMGTQVAGICDAFKSVLGSSVFANQVVVTMGGQFAVGNGSALLEIAMNTPDWTSAAYTHGVGAYHYAPYWSDSPGSASNTTDIPLLLSTANPLNALFDLMYSQTDRYGNNYSSVPSSGIIGSAVSTTTAIRSALSAQPWYSLPMLGYESGENFLDQWSSATAWIKLFEQASRDPRMQYCYYDPTSQFSSNPGYLVVIRSAGFQSINQFNSCCEYSKYGVWGALESTMQPTSPISSAPPKAQGIARYAAA